MRKKISAFMFLLIINSTNALKIRKGFESDYFYKISVTSENDEEIEFLSTLFNLYKAENHNSQKIECEKYIEIVEGFKIFVIHNNDEDSSQINLEITCGSEQDNKTISRVIQDVIRIFQTQVDKTKIKQAIKEARENPDFLVLFLDLNFWQQQADKKKPLGYSFWLHWGKLYYGKIRIGYPYSPSEKAQILCFYLQSIAIDGFMEAKTILHGYYH